MASLLPYVFDQFTDDNGNPLAAGTITFYAAGTSTPLDTYTTTAGTVINSNPVVLDSAGRATIFLGTTAYDMILKNSVGTTIKTYSNITASAGAASLQTTATLATQRLLPPGSSDYVLVGGATALGDGGSYLYYWSSTSSGTDDGINIVTPSSAPVTGRWLRLFQNLDTEGFFTATLLGVTTTVTGTAYYSRKGKSVTLAIPSLEGTSNTGNCVISGLPAAIRPTTGLLPCAVACVRENSLYYTGSASLDGGATLSMGVKTTLTGIVTNGFTASGQKGVPNGFQITYMMQ